MALLVWAPVTRVRALVARLRGRRGLEGVHALREAAELAPERVEVVGVVVARRGRGRHGRGRRGRVDAHGGGHHGVGQRRRYLGVGEGWVYVTPAKAFRINPAIYLSLTHRHRDDTQWLTLD